MSRNSRRWCFTSWNVDVSFELCDYATYMVYQLEKAKTTERLHYQGYVEFSQPVGMNTVKLLVKDNTAHCEKAISDVADDYCKKEDTRVDGPWILGVKKDKKPGKRSDLDAIVQLVQSGLPKHEIVFQIPSALKFINHIDKLMTTMIPKRIKKPIVYWYYGPTGTGKSRKAYELFPDAYFKNNSKWWDGYIGQKDVIWNDYDADSIPFNELLLILDHYPVKGEFKGGMLELNFENIVFTTHKHPEYVIKNRSRFDELRRRIEILTEFLPLSP